MALKLVCFKNFILAVLILSAGNLVSQNETNRWYFGNNAGLDFSTSPPTILTNGSINTIEGCATISDALGNLLFYTDGITVYDKTHVAMANGTGLSGNSSSSQSAIIAKQPGNTNIYCIFTQSGPYGTGAAYSLVDMNLAAGMGSVTVKNATLSLNCTEKLTSVKHCNGTDIWVIIHDWNSADFKSYLLSAAGVNTVPVISTTGTTHTVGANFAGCMKTSPNGKKLALAIHSLGTFELYDLDNSTGVVSNSLNLHADPVKFAYGVEFSPDGSKLYGGTGYANGFLYQWDLCAGSNSLIVASKYAVYTSTAGIAAMQTASNGKIYAARFSNQADLGVINNPNALGAACNYVDLGQSIAPKTTVWSVPNFITSYFKSPPPPFTYTASCSSYSFNSAVSTSLSTTCGSSANPVTNMSWNFGDPASGISNTSILSNPTHTYSSTGPYTAQLILYYACSSDTIRVTIPQVAATPNMSVVGNYTICKGDKRVYTASGTTTYTWSTGLHTSTISLSPTVTTVYSVSGTGTNSCKAAKQFTLTVNKCTDIEAEAEEASAFKLYPNPNHGTLFLETPSEVQIKIRSQLGELVFEASFEPGKHNIDISELGAGIYSAKISHAKGTKTIRLVKTE